MATFFPRQFFLQTRWITGMLQTLKALILSVQEFDPSSCRDVWVLMNASIVRQVTFPRSDCNELWGLASIFPMVPKNRINSRVRVNEWTKAHVVQRLVSVLMNLESTQSWLKLSWRLNPLKKWPGHPISS